MRPVIKPALVRLWRDESCLQLGLDPHRAVVLHGLDRTLAGLLDRLDGTRELEAVVADAVRAGADAAQARRLVALLRAADLLDDAVHPQPREQLLPELHAASVLHGGDDGGLGVLARRAAARVLLVGSGRLARGVAAHLREAGVGQVETAAATLPLEAPVLSPRPSVVVLTDRSWLDPVLVAALMRAGLPHLVARLTEVTGVVGPLVLPGRSSCLRCHHLHRAARDPAWPRLSAQLVSTAAPAAGSLVLTGAVAAHAALQVLALLDPAPPARSLPAAVDGQLEISAATGSARRRTWTWHDACGCDWDAAEPAEDGAETTTGAAA